MFQSSEKGEAFPGDCDMCKIRYGVFNAYFSRSLNVGFAGEQGKNDRLARKVSLK